MSEKRPNDELFNTASQTRTANDIAEAKIGRYNPSPCPQPGSSAPPATKTPFQIKGA